MHSELSLATPQIRALGLFDTQVLSNTSCLSLRSRSESGHAPQTWVEVSCLSEETSVATTEAVSPLHERLLAAVGDRTYRRIGELTKTHPETVRRYLQGQSPSVDFVMSLCSALSVSGQWLLTGEGPMKAADVRDHALQDANPGELLSAIAGTLDKLGDRLDRLERFVQGLDVRVRGRGAAAHGASDGSGAPAQGTEVDARARAIGDALTKRPPETSD